MAGGNFVHRVMSYVVNELIVNSLANRTDLFLIGCSFEVKDVSSLSYLVSCTITAKSYKLFAAALKAVRKDIRNWFAPCSEISSNLLFHEQCKIPFIASCPAFQRFAVRTSRRIEDISSKAAQKREELAEQMKDFSKNFEQQSKNQ